MVSSNSSGLLACLRSGRQRALAELYMKQRPCLRRMIDRRLDHRLSKRVDASDILQEGYVDAAQRLNEYLGDPSMPFWLWLRFLVKQRLCAIHRRHLGAGKRDARREQGLPLASQQEVESGVLAVELSASITSPSKQAARAELQSRLHDLIENLEPLDREIVALRHIKELSNDETAAELGLSKSAASKRYIRAIERIRNTAVSMKEEAHP